MLSGRKGLRVSKYVSSSFIPYFQSMHSADLDMCTDSGWPGGIGWLLGLLQAGLGLTGFDAVAHMIGKCYVSEDLHR